MYANQGIGKRLLVSSGIQYYVSDRKPSDKARLGGAISIAATNFIATVGPEISFGLGNNVAVKNGNRKKGIQRFYCKSVKFVFKTTTCTELVKKMSQRRSTG
jgi:hypothetical protein